MRRTLATALLVLPLAFSGIAGTLEDGTETYDACTGSADIVVSPGSSFDEDIATPIGALNFSEEEIGTVMIDLAGLPVGERASVGMTLSWDTPEIGDYDLIIDGENALSTDSPEYHGFVDVAHCRTFDLAVTTFTGTPLDTVHLEITAD